MDILELAKPLSLEARCYAIQATNKQWWGKGRVGFPAGFGILNYTLCGFGFLCFYKKHCTSMTRLR